MVTATEAQLEIDLTEKAERSVRNVQHLRPKAAMISEIDGEDVEQVQQEAEDTGGGVTPPRSPHVLPHQLRPVTINLASDSTGANVHSENGETSPIERAMIDGDEIDVLSASQLSHDLDQHISQTTGIEAEASHAEVTLESQADLQNEDQGPRRVSQRRLKRKSSSQKATSGKRRRTQSLSSFSIEKDRSVYNTPGEMLDRTDFAPSHAVQAVTGNVRAGDTDLASPTKRKRGRPRKRPLAESQNQSTEVQNSRVEVTLRGTSLVKEETVEEIGVMESLLQEHELAGSGKQRLEAGLGIAEAATTVVADSAELGTEDHRAACEANAQPNIMASLDSILDRLKSTQPGDVDLRSVDELCFQIRFQAQVVAQRQGA